MSALEVALKDGRQKAALEEIESQSKVPERVARDMKVLRAVGDKNPADMVIPEHFFTVTAVDIARATEGGSESTLTTEYMRQKQELARRRKYQKTLIRVQFPDGMLVQATFSPREQVRHLYEEVRGCINDHARPFTLSLGAQKLQQPNRSLWDAQLVPSALLHFRWQEIKSSDDMSAIIRDELLCAVEFLE